MAEYLISYDLEPNATRDRYTRLGESLAKRGARRVLLSQWVMVGASSRAIFDAVKDLFVTQDRLLVSPYWDITYHNLMS